MKKITLNTDKLKQVLLISLTCLCATTFVSCGGNDDDPSLENPQTTSDQALSYVVPVSATEFEILGTRVNINNVSNNSANAFAEMIAQGSGIPKNYTSINQEDGEVVYADAPSFTTQYGLNDLDGFYAVDTDGEETLVALCKGNNAYLFTYEVIDGTWQRVDPFPGIEYLNMELTETSDNCIKFTYDLPDSFRTLFVAAYIAQGGTQEQAEAMLDDRFVTTTMRIVDIDRTNHVMLVAVHYAGEKALELATEYGLAGDDNDFWLLQNFL